MNKQNPFNVIDDALPEKLQARLLELQVTEKIWFFLLGDLANDIWKWCVKHKAGYYIDPFTFVPFTFEMICWYVGRKLDGKHGSTSIYNYANLAQRLKSKKKRDKYAILPISHFDYACQFDDTTMLKILDHSLAETDRRGGKPPSRDMLMRHFEPERFETQRDLVDQTPALDLDEYIPDDGDPAWSEAELPVNRDEIILVNNAFQYLHTALQRFRRQNPQFEIVTGIISTIMDLNQRLLQVVNEYVKE